MASQENDESLIRAELFDMLAHPTRIRILKKLSEKPMSFTELKRALDIESNGLLQHHLGKLGDLVKQTPDGNYAITDDGKEALRLLDTMQSAQARPFTEVISKGIGNWIAIAFVLGLGTTLLIGAFWCIFLSPTTATYVVKLTGGGSGSIDGLKNETFPFMLLEGNTVIISIEVLDSGAHANVFFYDPDYKTMFSSDNTTNVHFGVIALMSGWHYLRIQNPNPYSIRYQSNETLSAEISYQPLQAVGGWFFIFSIPVFGLAFGLWWLGRHARQS